MKQGAWKEKRLLLKERAKLYLERPLGYVEKIKELDEALIVEDKRHELAVKKFKMSRKSWNLQNKKAINQ